MIITSNFDFLTASGASSWRRLGAMVITITTPHLHTTCLPGVGIPISRGTLLSILAEVSMMLICESNKLLMLCSCKQFLTHNINCHTAFSLAH